MSLSRLAHFINQNYHFLEVLLENLKTGIITEIYLILTREDMVRPFTLLKKGRAYSLLCFAQYIKPEERSDRVIATKWDAAFVLYDGVPTKNDIDRLRRNVPKQESGKVIL